MRRLVLLLTVMAAAVVLASGVALAQPGGAADVCVSIKGDTKVDKGASSCLTDTTGKAVAVNDSDALAFDNSKATAVNNSFAGALDCVATAQNGEMEFCR
jgi:hypothetical protein